MCFRQASGCSWRFTCLFVAAVPAVGWHRSFVQGKLPNTTSIHRTSFLADSGGHMHTIFVLCSNVYTFLLFCCSGLMTELLEIQMGHMIASAWPRTLQILILVINWMHVVPKAPSKLDHRGGFKGSCSAQWCRGGAREQILQAWQHQLDRATYGGFLFSGVDTRSLPCLVVPKACSSDF